MTLANLITLIVIFAFFRMIAKLLTRQAEEEETPERFRKGRFRAPEEKIKEYLTSLGVEVEPEPAPEVKEIKTPPAAAPPPKERLSAAPPPRVQRARKREEESYPTPLLGHLNKNTLEQGIILSEILGPPRARRSLH